MHGADIPGADVHRPDPGSFPMPITFPQYDAATDELHSRTYYTADEVGELLHLHPGTVRARVRDGVWDALHVGRNVFMSAAQVGAAVEQMQTDGRAPEPEPVQLGEPVSDVDLEPLQ